ncbi:HAD family hydrolase [bacterium]|nr:HAD family hydrolase [bacterium]MBU1958856.1 HAD family hydrolase [bacterium]
MKATILFDLDGTLIDSTEAILEGFKVAFETFEGIVPSNEAIKNEIGHTLENMFRTLGVEEEKVEEHVHAYKMHYRTIHCEKTILIEGAREAVEEASRFATLGVVTTKTGQYSTELLEHMNLMHHFAVLIGREHVENPKPHKEPILKALTKLEHDKSRTWMIGDTCMDIDSAKNAKIHAIAVTSGYSTHSMLEKCASTLCKNIVEAIDYIKKSDESYK